MLKDSWKYIYGEKSHMNLAGKLILGVPLAPLVLVFALTWDVLDALFTKREG